MFIFIHIFVISYLYLYIYKFISVINFMVSWSEVLNFSCPARRRSGIKYQASVCESKRLFHIISLHRLPHFILDEIIYTFLYFSDFTFINFLYIFFGKLFKLRKLVHTTKINSKQNQQSPINQKSLQGSQTSTHDIVRTDFHQNEWFAASRVGGYYGPGQGSVSVVGNIFLPSEMDGNFSESQLQSLKDTKPTIQVVLYFNDLAKLLQQL